MQLLEILQLSSTVCLQLSEGNEDATCGQNDAGVLLIVAEK